eukprot:Lithocolla_globosa_v1_NODE_1125_length_2811_cov_40.797210.p1 type:complete len:136 gc:universal NODE_1125_length_2811_cov_40.797210:2236-2643(+)
MHQVNAWREKHGEESVSRSCVRNGANSVGVRKFRRLGSKCGNSDKNSPWALARLAQAKQFLEQVTRVGPVRGKRKSGCRTVKSFHLAQVFWIDEKHKKCVLGCASKWEYQVVRTLIECQQRTPSIPRRPVSVLES